MPHSLRFVILAGVTVSAAVGASGGTDPKSEREKQWRADVLTIAKDYERFGRVDHEARWAPHLCRMPLDPKARMSQSPDAATHGKKLYSLFAKSRPAYARTTKKYAELKEAPIGQWIVKESWTPEEFTGDSTEIKPVVREMRIKDEDGNLVTDVFIPFGTHDGKTYRAKVKAGLFVMMKYDSATPDTDQGWVYATVAKDLKSVTAIGRIESCIKCHQDAKWDRQFGLKMTD